MQSSPPNNLIPSKAYNTQFANRLKKILLTLTALLILTLATLIYAFHIRPHNKIDALHAKYLTITRPTTYAQVLQTMGPNPTLDEPGQGSAFWDDDYPPPNADESSKITHILRYTIPTWYLGVTFEFTFDKDQNLIGKHRYD